MVNDFIPYLPYPCKGIVFYTLNNKCSNFAFLLPRDTPFENKSTSEIEDICKSQFPKLYMKKEKMPDNISSTNNTNDTDDTDDINDIYNTNNTNNINNTSNIFGKQIDNNTHTINSHSDELKENTENITAIGTDNVILKILKTDMPDIYNLYSHDNNKKELYKIGIALVPNIKISQYLYNIFKSNPNTLNMNVECKYSKIFEKWVPIRIVNDSFPIHCENDIEKIEEKLKQH